MSDGSNSVLIPSIIGFSSTSLDDFAVMLIYFAQAQMMENPREGYIKVITAQAIAFTVVILVSLVGILLGVLVPMSYVDLIGILPLCIGIIQCYEAWTDKPEIINSINGERYRSLSDSSDDDYIYSLESPRWFEEENISLVNDRLPSKPVTPIDKVGINAEFTNVALEKTCLDKLFDPFTFEVLVFALVCSCDNIAIYVAMFAAMELWEVFIIVLLFYILLGVTIILSIIIMQYGPIVNCFARHSKLVVPVMFVGLGIYILSHSVIMIFTPWRSRLAS